MDFSSANIALWSPVIQLGTIAALILLANVLRRKIQWIRNSLMPTAVLAGFILLFLRSIGFQAVTGEFLESVTYHAIALGFIAMALRVTEKTEGKSKYVIDADSCIECGACFDECPVCAVEEV